MCFVFIWQNILVTEEGRWMWCALLNFVAQTAAPSAPSRLVLLAGIMETLPVTPQQGKKPSFQKNKINLKFTLQWKMRTIYFKAYFQKKVPPGIQDAGMKTS